MVIDFMMQDNFMKEAADKIKGLIDIQKKNGNYNYDEFMYGMIIGLEYAYYSLLEERKINKNI